MSFLSGRRPLLHAGWFLSATLYGPALQQSTIPYLLRMLHHVSLGVFQIEQAAAFFDAALRPLGYVRVWSDLRPGEQGQAVGYGPPGGSDQLALKQVQEAGTLALPGFHLAFAATSRKAVASFHAAALKAGAKDNGAPGLREHYGPDYFAAFVISPEGYRLEAVCKRAGHGSAAAAGVRWRPGPL